jgi:hypothetical protein
MGQFVDVDATIGEDAAVAVDVANLGRGGDNSLKSFGSLVCG